jgi:hypothetical protein
MKTETFLKVAIPAILCYIAILVTVVVVAVLG